MKEFLSLLAIIRRSVELEDHVKNKIRDITVNFSFVHLFYNQFTKVCSRLSFECADQLTLLQKPDYAKALKGTAWLLFVLIRRLESSREASQLH